MKNRLSFSVLVLFLAVLLYTACTKNALKPATSTSAVNYKTLSSQVAALFYRSIIGQYGGTDVSKGIVAPFSTGVGGRNVLAVNSMAPQCGSIIDTTYNNSTGGGLSDSSTTQSGFIKFVYTCDAGIIDGYTVYDSVTYSKEVNFIIHDTTVVQNYAVKALNSTYKLVSMNGTLTSSQTMYQEDENIFSNASYVLTGLTVDFTSGVADVTTGTATFQMTTTTQATGVPSTPVTYTGTIQFLGNYQAKLTINPGHVYTVNLTTGVATPD
jgi:hypothetical protein